MTTPSTKLTVIPLPGLTLDTLGLYFTALGLLRVLSREWPSVRGCWRDGCFVVLGPESLSVINDYIYQVGIDQTWSDYGKPWDAQQKKDTKLSQVKKLAVNVAHWQSHLASESEAMLQQSHLATGQRLSFNPLFGTGGNAGKRLFWTGWQRARTEVVKPPRGISAEIVKADLAALLSATPCQHLSDFGAGSWFSAANKIYNSGTRKPYSDGQVTPWAMLLACEAFPLLAGSASRQLGSQRKATAAFPFVTRSTAPLNEQAAGQRLGEFWAPVWDRPMTLAEATALYQTGKAEVAGKAALTSVAFAAAIVHRGIDAGIQEFRSFALLRTTSENTFESRLTSIIKVPRANPMFSEITRCVIQFRDNLPHDTEQGTKKRYKGLQGPIDQALIALAEAIGQGTDREDLQVERSWNLLDQVFAALAKVDRNKSHREAEVRFELLSLDWLNWLLERTHQQHSEICLALALASLRPQAPKQASAAAALKLPQRFLAYRLGATGKGKYWTVPKDVPLRRVWSPTQLESNLAALSKRRLIESSPNSPVPLTSEISASVADALLFLAHQTDDEALATWIDRFSLFDWTSQHESKTSLRQWAKAPYTAPSPDATAMLYAFLRPHFDNATLAHLQTQTSGGESTKQSKVIAKAGRLSAIIAALDGGNISTAWANAAAAYRAERVPIADFPDQTFAHNNPRRLLAALIFPVSYSGLNELAKRWQSP
jgi:CRISPR-associated protein Csx17